MPAHPGRAAQGLDQRLLGGEARRQRLDAAGRAVAQHQLGLAEQAGAQGRRAVERAREALQVDHVDPDAHDHDLRRCVIGGPLLDGDRLGEVARLVDVEALGRGELHPEDVQRHDGEQRLEQRGRERDVQHLVGEGQHRGVALLGDRDDAGASGADLLDVRDDLRVQRARVAGRRHDHEDDLARARSARSGRASARRRRSPRRGCRRAP